jgi:glycosyltransferase involved in cell wall biosynthesis
MIKRGVGILHYNRPDNLKEIIEAVLDTAVTEIQVVIADDGSEVTP